MSTSDKKRGKLSREEEQIIYSNMSSMSDEEIAEILKRTPEVVAKHRAQAPVIQDNNDATHIINQLHKKFFWKETLEQLVSDDEIEFFERYWASLIGQFAQQGILPTDELMMRDLITSEININRCLRGKSNVMRELTIVEKEMDDCYKQYTEPIQRLPILGPLHSRASTIRGTVKAYNDEWKILQEKKDKKLDQLKATRQLRLDKIEKAGRSFIDLVKLLDSPEMREKEGRLNELYKTAAELAKLRFEQVVKYENGHMDRAFLTPEAEEKDNEEESKSNKEAPSIT